jgi:hypothetical protein
MNDDDRTQPAAWSTPMLIRVDVTDLTAAGSGAGSDADNSTGVATAAS